MTYGGHTYGGSPYASTSDPTLLATQTPVFRVIRDGTTVEDSVFDVDPVVDTANPFGDFCVVKMDDRGGEKFDRYPRGTRVDVEIAFDATSKIERFTGYVVERRETEQQGADVLEVEAYSFDQFLRRNNVTNSQLGNTIVEALEDIITTDTPVTYDASNIDVGDDQELTRTYQGEPVENVLRDLAFKSNNEDFGVNDDLEFFFRPRETVHIDRGIDNTLWFNYDIPELGKEAVNEVEVWFDDGEESVIVDDGTDKLDLQDSLGLPDPGTQRAELNRPFITDINDAEDEGRKYLEFRNATLSGTVTTFGLYDARPGDTIDVTIDPRGIDEEFVIAAIEYRWGADQTILTIVEKRGDVDDILTELNDSVQRQEMEGANRDAPKNRITTKNATALVDVTVDADGNTPVDDRFVNDGRRLVRDGWAGKSYSAISNIVVGSDGSGLSRSNDTMNSQTNTASTTQTLPTSTSVEFSASITQTGVEEIGLTTADDTLVARAVFDTPVDLAGTVTVTLDVSNDDSVSRGVLTNDGQTAVRDVLASDSPALPNAYAYGSDNTPVSESDTALGNELVDVSLDEVLIQNADTTAQWESVVGSIAADSPESVENGEYGLLESCEQWDALTENDGESGPTLGFIDDDAYNDGQALFLAQPPQQVRFEFTPEYDIPASRVGIQLRIELDNNEAHVSLNWDDTRFSGFDLTSSTIPLGWQQFGQQTTVGDDTWANTINEDLEAGETYVLRIDVEDASNLTVDCVAVYDNQYSYNFANPDAATNGGGFIAGPESFPDQVTRSFATAETRRNVTEANFDLTANDVSGNFYVELANDGSTFTRVSNSSTGSVSFAGPERNVDTNVSLGRYGSRTDAFPTEGYLGQSIDVWQLFANPDASVTDSIGGVLTRGVVPPGSITGETVKEAGLKSDSTLLTRHILAEFDVLSGQRISSSETTSFVGDN